MEVFRVVLGDNNNDNVTVVADSIDEAISYGRKYWKDDHLNDVMEVSLVASDVRDARPLLPLKKRK